MKKHSFLLWLFLLVASLPLCAQEVYENDKAEVYNYLARMAQKGLIEFNDNVRPLTKNYLHACLDSVAAKKQQLTSVEQAELQFYLQEYLGANTNKVTALGAPHLFSKDAGNRWRSLYANGSKSALYVDPVVNLAVVEGDHQTYTSTSSGLHFWGNVGKHIGFQFFYNDVIESGKGYDTTRIFSAETGIIRKDTSNLKSLNFTEFRGSVNYAFKNGSVAIGQDHLLYGYGQNGRIILSDKAPNYPFLRIDYDLFPWLHFNNTHAWLSSNIVDSAKTYGTGNILFGGEREIFVPKFFATHSLQIKAAKGLDVSVGESVVYSDRLDFGYLIPVMFFKVYDNIVNNSHIQAGSNSQIFFTVSSRNQIKNTHLYGSLFVDEIRMSTVFVKSKSRNQLGYTLGVDVTDLPLPYLNFVAEYTRINPFVYNNLIPAQTYTNHNYSLGDWMGNNADRLLLAVKYTPLPRLKCAVRYQAIRKGSAGTVVDQYLQQPQPPFLFGNQVSSNEWNVNIHYELLNSLMINANYSHWNTVGSTWSMGIRYGF